jgi:hypothetical protein
MSLQSPYMGLGNTTHKLYILEKGLIFTFF